MSVKRMATGFLSKITNNNHRVCKLPYFGKVDVLLIKYIFCVETARLEKKQEYE